MPKLYNLLTLYLQNKEMTVNQQNALIVNLFIALIIFNILFFVANLFIKIIIQNKDVTIEIQKQRASKRDSIYENIYQRINSINRSFENNDNQKQININSIKELREVFSSNSLYISRTMRKTINNILDHLTIVNATDPSKQNSLNYLNLINKFEKEFEKK